MSRHRRCVRDGEIFGSIVCFALLVSALSAADLPLLYDGSTIRVPAEIDRKLSYLVFDTGCTASALDQSIYRSELTDPVAEARVSSIAGIDTLELYRAPRILLGNIGAQIERIAAMDLSRVNAVSGSECDGILGADFLQRHVVSINFDRHIFAIDRVEENAAPGNQTLDLEPVGNGNFAINARVEGTPLTLMIDTGDNGSISLNAEDWRRVIRSHRARDVHTILAAPVSGDPIRCMAVRINDVSVGPYHYRGFIATALRNPAAPSTIGLRFFRQHAVTLDFKEGELVLQPGLRFGETETFDMSGLHLIRLANRTMVYAVDENSPAASAGITAGDVVEAVDRNPTKSLSMWDIRRALKTQDGAQLILTVRHGAAVTDRSFQLKKVL